MRTHRKTGHFRSKRARDNFLSVYWAAMAELPPVSESVDVPTSFGTVRAYRFDRPFDGLPVVLLPGRNASTPMWRANLAPLLMRRAVVAIDLLGEAGLSVQDKPITDELPDAALISTAARHFVIRKAMPRMFTDEQLHSLARPVLALIAGRSVMLDPPRAAARARRLLPRGQVELWPGASHAINGEYPDEIAQRAHCFWETL